jgi:hypothetical protein
MTRDDAIRTAIFTLADWHRRDHGERCVCLEGEQARGSVGRSGRRPGGGGDDL